ncbi:AraC family transcriptional regulator [Stenotrophomonas sp. HITSZ_GD]|uniref:helix-turn-helix transcriptional regulator n=1 Tax=Stenotrophomonas sp. HITSZ_GD TaxID=3037248 RepID=UPI00240D5629|nr:AraC family transcriptional regulator [Stenotrophomonas sp. HITSZ_GD]MDG2526347.1 AraC family transcriptional regulator [Stenotrophomonas sp. HITSZ_GD]
MPSSTALSLRSYGPDASRHAHDHVQVVLPLAGGMHLEVGGRGAALDLAHGAFIAPGTAHAQAAPQPNCFLILDCGVDDIGAAACERLAGQPWLGVSPSLRHLLDYLHLRRQGSALPAALARHCVPLLLRQLAPDAPIAARLHRLLERVEAAPGAAWPVERMAAELHVSASRLHALFKRELDTTPQAWLAELRLRHVMDALAATDVPVATLALDGGWADQTTLTRAMRRATGYTPAAFRRARRAMQ